MFLKNAKQIFMHRNSITGQLTLFYSSSLFILITLISFFLYWMMTNILYDAARQFIADEISIIRNILEDKPNNIRALKQEVNDIPNSLQSSAYHYYIRVLDANGIIAETPQMNNISVAKKFLNNTTNILSIKANHAWQSHQGDQHYLLAQSVIKSTKENKAWLIHIALNVSAQQIIINEYRNILFLIVSGGALLSIALGYLISRKGMRHLHDLTQTTKKMTTNILQQRIDPEHWPRELNELGIAYNQMLDRIEFSFSKLIQFSDDLAHELRTPINNLMGEAEIALSHLSTPEEYQQLIGSILEELNRIFQIIENILFLARAENPEIDLQKTLLNVNHEIGVMCRFYQAIADEKNIKLSCEGDTLFLANLVMFRRMIGNLLSNAIKYSKPEGEIYISIKEMERDNIQVRITDNGIGILPEHLPNLFQRFYRVDTARTHYSGGMGLGLSIVKSIVDLHQGTILIESALNKGTSIILNFPKCA